MAVCNRYVGVACVDGTCPKSNVDEYEERCMPIIDKCSDCWYYLGCEDCAWCDTVYCVQRSE